MSAAEDISTADGAASSFELLREDGGLRLRFVGAWTTRELARHDAALRRLDLQGARAVAVELGDRSEEHTSELQSLMRISYAVFCLKKKKEHQHKDTDNYRIKTT